MAIKTPETNSSRDHGYQVVARKYRPLDFTKLVGQAHIAQGLSTAITTQRVGHAYLFTGARGTGKTSTARIFAKALNCVHGPTPSPCGQCDVCQGVTAGDDLDVIEIDAASNRGIDEIRQLRANAGKTPSRARYKIYIIDEVHMLTKEAFNALLKTLEEPPEHVKFMLCTTDPEKIPITVLSRCQRFDFAPVATEEIKQRLREICEAEGMMAEADALQMVARRAAGSMRDSQSLLEQLLSVCQGQITVADVNRMLGTAQSGRLGELAAALAARDVQQCLLCVDYALRERADVGQLAEQLLEYLRDILAASLGASRDILLATSPDVYDHLVRSGKQLGCETLLAMLQILDHALVRMRQSMHPRVLLEIAIIRMCQLEALDELSQVLGQLQSGVIAAASAPTAARPGIAPPTTTPMPIARPATMPNIASPPASAGNSSLQKKTDHGAPEPDSPPYRASDEVVLTAQNASEIWRQVVESLGDMTGDMAAKASRIAISGPNRLVVTVPAAYIKEYCERPTSRNRLEQQLLTVTGQTIRVDFEAMAEAAKPLTVAPATVNKRQLMKDRERNSLVQQAMEVFEAEMVEVVEPRRSS